jgi:hypothetical protein
MCELYVVNTQQYAVIDCLRACKRKEVIDIVVNDLKD